MALNFDHLTLAEGPLVSWFLEGGRSRTTDRRKGSQVRSLESGARQALGEHSSMAGRPCVCHRPGPPPDPRGLRRSCVLLVASPEQIAGVRNRPDCPDCTDDRRAFGHGPTGRGLRAAPKLRTTRTREHVNRRLPVHLPGRCFLRPGFGHAGTYFVQAPNVVHVALVMVEEARGVAVLSPTVSSNSEERLGCAHPTWTIVRESSG